MIFSMQLYNYDEKISDFQMLDDGSRRLFDRKANTIVYSSSSSDLAECSLVFFHTAKILILKKIDGLSSYTIKFSTDVLDYEFNISGANLKDEFQFFVVVNTKIRKREVFSNTAKHAQRLAIDNAFFEIQFELENQLFDS